MSGMSAGLNSYRQTQVQSRTPLELVVMLYDGALRFLGAAREAIVRHDIAARRDAISRTLAIISELQSTLNIEEGGELARSLDELYGYTTRRLIDATVTNDVKAVDEVRRVFEALRDAWQTIANPVTQASGAAAAGSRR